MTPGAVRRSSKRTVAAVTPAGPPRPSLEADDDHGIVRRQVRLSALSLAIVDGGTRMARVVYLAPQDRGFNPVYRDAIRNAMIDLQQWYGSQLGGRSFRWHSLTSDECRLPRPADCYGVDSWTKVSGQAGDNGRVPPFELESGGFHGMLSTSRP